MTSAAEAIEPDSTKLKGVSWQDGVDGKSLFTVSSQASRQTGFAQRAGTSVTHELDALSLHHLTYIHQASPPLMLDC